MQKVLKQGAVLALGFAVAGAMLIAGLGKAQARPNFPRAFATQYPKLQAKVKVAKCGVCHPRKNNKKKKIRNNYGKALAKTLDAKKVKDKKKLKAAFEKIEKMPSATKGKTFGDLIKEGKLPGETK